VGAVGADAVADLGGELTRRREGLSAREHVAAVEGGRDHLDLHGRRLGVALFHERAHDAHVEAEVEEGGRVDAVRRVVGSSGADGSLSFGGHVSGVAACNRAIAVAQGGRCRPHLRGSLEDHRLQAAAGEQGIMSSRSLLRWRETAQHVGDSRR
jgi:hypothetical protein